MKFTTTILLIAATFATIISNAQQFTLEECRNMALENNHSVKAKQIELQSAVQTRKEAFTAYFPTVDASGFAFKANKHIINSGIALPQMPPIPLEMLKNGKTAAITASQPIFAGGQIYNSNRLSSVSVEVQTLLLSMSETEIKEKVEEYFWQIASLKEKLNTISTVEKLLEQVHKDVIVAVKAGISPMNDQLRVELQQQNVASNRLKVENGLAISKMALAQLVGSEMLSFDITTASFSEPEKPAVIYIDAAQATPMRDEIKLMDKNIRAAQLQKKIEFGKCMPSVGVGATYAYDNFSGSNNNFGLVFASVSIPLSQWWGGSHAIRRQELKVKLSENEKQNASEQLFLQINMSWNSLVEAFQQTVLAKQSIVSAKENLRLNNDYYKAGTVSLSDLLDAQTLFQQSKDRYTEAFASYQVQRLKYLQATGR